MPSNSCDKTPALMPDSNAGNSTQHFIGFHDQWK